MQKVLIRKDKKIYRSENSNIKDQNCCLSKKTTIYREVVYFLFLYDNLNMLFGAHISIADGIENTPKKATEAGCEVFQIFSRPPQNFSAPLITNAQAARFRENMEKFRQKECYIHTPYILNLASPEKRIADNSVRIIREEMERASLLGAKYVLSHLGSAKGLPKDQALSDILKRLKIILNGDFSSVFLIEISAGAGNIIGSNFKEISYFLRELKNFDVGVCFDTAHAFESGYDLRTKELADRTFSEFGVEVGLDNLKLFHFNDSKTDFGSRKDRHEHIGLGKIGKEGFEAIIKNEKLAHINGIIETPRSGEMRDIDNLAVLKNLR